MLNSNAVRRSVKPGSTKHHPTDMKIELPRRTAKALSITSVFALALFVSPLVFALIGLLSGLA